MLVAAIAYAGNTWFLKPHTGNQIAHGYLNDVFAMPFILAYSNLLIILGEQPRLLITTPLRIALFTLFCGATWEVIGPLISARATYDAADFVAYALGSVCYYVFETRSG
jgi:hypothetical protein